MKRDFKRRWRGINYKNSGVVDLREVSKSKVEGCDRMNRKEPVRFEGRLTGKDDVEWIEFEMETKDGQIVSTSISTPNVLELIRKQDIPLTFLIQAGLKKLWKLCILTSRHLGDKAPYGVIPV